MSADTVDDLHAAEDYAGGLAELVLELLPRSGRVPPGFDQLRALARGWQSYCRPSCGAEGQPGECDDDDCGCPCGHADEE